MHCIVIPHLLTHFFDFASTFPFFPPPFLSLQPLLSPLCSAPVAPFFNLHLSFLRGAWRGRKSTPPYALCAGEAGRSSLRPQRKGLLPRRCGPILKPGLHLLRREREGGLDGNLGRKPPRSPPRPQGPPLTLEEGGRKEKEGYAACAAPQKEKVSERAAEAAPRYAGCVSRPR